MSQATSSSSQNSEKDKARLSPLASKHINILGHYSFTLAENVTKGKLRPLNQAFKERDFP